LAPSRQITTSRQSDGHYKITAAHSGKAPDVGAAPRRRGRLDHLTLAGQRLPKLGVVDVGGDYYRITAKISGKSLDEANYSTANGADAIVRTYTGTDCQEVAHQDDAGGLGRAMRLKRDTLDRREPEL
jgi:hypothetical protein